MSVDLKRSVCKIKVENEDFQSARDKDFAIEVWKRFSLQSMLELCSSSLTDLAQKRELEDYYIRILNILIQKSPDNWIKTYVDGFNEEDLCSLCFNSVRTVSRVAEIPPVSEREYYVFSESDFIGVAERVCLVQTILQTLLRRVVNCSQTSEDTDSRRCKVHVAVCLLSLVSQHMKRNLWTSELSIAKSSESLKLLTEEFNCSTVSELLVIDAPYTNTFDESSELKTVVRKSLIGKLLLQWKPALQRQSWRQYPAVIAGFQWCLCRLRFPNLSDFIELLLPPSLLFIDDHVTQNKELGTVCLIHILQNSTSEVLRWYGRADVIYQALKLQLYTTEDRLLKLTHEAMLLTLKVIVKDKDTLGITTKYDEVFSVILQAAFGENKLILRRIHTEQLYVFIEAMGINVVKYMTKLLDLFEDYLEISDAPKEQARLNTLKALESLIKVAWPRIPSHLGFIIKILVKLLHQSTSQQLSILETIEAELISYIVVCFQLLMEVDREKVVQYLRSLNDCAFSKKCTVLLQQLCEM